ncbi:MAG: DUF2784 domain-containing protein [Acidobacteria bacterium]|nr:DUF2784 domain-containing protein [Acidobacteriota bacterium]
MRWLPTLWHSSHLAFLAFVVFGAFLGHPSRFWRYTHIGSMVDGVLIEVFYWYCPLTYVEQYLRRKARRGFYEESFIAHYLNPWIYVEEFPQGA